MAERAQWQEVHAKLERARQALEAGGQPPREEVKRILRERAQALAKPLAEAPAPGEVLELLVFSLAEERYGIETTHVLEVVPLRELTPVPCTPSFFLGVINHRGLILSILDFRRLFELASREVTGGGRVVAVHAGGMTFGVLADAVAGAIQVPGHEVAPPPVGLTGTRQAFIRGVTAEMVAVLDLEALARDPRIVVNESVEVSAPSPAGRGFPT